MPFDVSNLSHISDAFDAAFSECNRPTATIAAKRRALLDAFDAARLEPDAVSPDQWRALCFELAAVVPAPKGIKPKAERERDESGDWNLALARAEWLQEHPAPAGDDVPRWSNPGFPFPMWSDADLARPDPRKTVGGAGPRSGDILLQDRRKPWQKNAASFRFDRTGTICTFK